MLADFTQIASCRVLDQHHDHIFDHTGLAEKTDVRQTGLKEARHVSLHCKDISRAVTKAIWWLPVRSAEQSLDLLPGCAYRMWRNMWPPACIPVWRCRRAENGAPSASAPELPRPSIESAQHSGELSKTQTFFQRCTACQIREIAVASWITQDFQLCIVASRPGF